MSEKTYRDFVKQQLDGRKEWLRTASFFECACCNIMKAKAEAAGVHLYKTDDKMLQKAMMDPGTGTPRVGTYVLCLECTDSVPEPTIQKNVTQNMAKQGLFGAPVK